MFEVPNWYLKRRTRRPAPSCTPALVGVTKIICEGSTNPPPLAWARQWAEALGATSEQSAPARVGETPL